MELTDILLGIFIAILSISTTSIGINYFKKANFSEDDKCFLSTSCKANRNFLIVMLVVSLLVAGGLFYEGSKHVNKFNAAKNSLFA